MTDNGELRREQNQWGLADLRELTSQWLNLSITNQELALELWEFRQMMLFVLEPDGPTAGHRINHLQSEIDRVAFAAIAAEAYQEQSRELRLDLLLNQQDRTP